MLRNLRRDVCGNRGKESRLGSKRENVPGVRMMGAGHSGG